MRDEVGQEVVAARADMGQQLRMSHDTARHDESYFLQRRCGMSLGSSSKLEPTHAGRCARASGASEEVFCLHHPSLTWEFATNCKRTPFKNKLIKYSRCTSHRSPRT